MGRLAPESRSIMETFWMIQSMVYGEEDLWAEYLTFNTEQEAWRQSFVGNIKDNRFLSGDRRRGQAPSLLFFFVLV